MHDKSLKPGRPTESMVETNPHPITPMPCQLRPDYRYRFSVFDSNNNPSTLADAFVANEGDNIKVGGDTLTGFAGGTEYWFYTNIEGRLSLLETTASVRVQAQTPADDASFDTSKATRVELQSVARVASWATTQKKYPQGSRSYTFWNTPPGGATPSFGLQLTIYSTSKTSDILVGIQWCQYVPTPTATLGGTISPEIFSVDWSRGVDFQSFPPNPAGQFNYFFQTSM